MPFDRISILGIKIDNCNMHEAVQWIVAPSTDQSPHHVFFVNAHCANIAYNDLEYRRLLNQSHLTLADGIGIKLAGIMLRQPVRDNVNGTDLFIHLCRALENTGRGIYLLGARPRIAEETAKWIGSNFPNVIVNGFNHGYFDKSETPRIAAAIAESGAEFLLVAFGVPYQEKWISQWASRCNVKVVLGVGGLFDYYSGRIPRAPAWMRIYGLEWVFRLYQEPARLFHRYVAGNPLFLMRVVWSRLKGR